MHNILWLLLLASMWAPSFLFIKIGLRGFPPLTLAGSRLALAAVLMLAVLAIRRTPLPRDASSWGKFFVMGLASNAFPFAMFSIGELHADSGLAAIINGTTPIFTTIFAHLAIHDERMNATSLTGILVGFAGILALFLPELHDAFRGDMVAVGMACFGAASVSYGISTVFARKYLRGYPPLVTPTGQFVTSSLTLLPIALLVEQPFDRIPGADAVASVVILALVGTVLAYIVFYRLIERNSATFVSYVTYILPPAGLLLGVVFLDEQPGWNALLGGLFVLVGVMIVNGMFSSVSGRWFPRRP